MKCHRAREIKHNSKFIKCIVEQVRNHKWSFDICVGYAKLHNLFPKI